MKLPYICLLAAFFATASSAVAAPTATAEILASGTGNVSLPPNIATVRASIETNAMNATEATSENNARYDAVVASLEKLGVARSDITLDYYNVSYRAKPAVVSPNAGAQEYGYRVSRSFSVVVRTIDKAGSVTDAALASGATSIEGVDFGLSDASAVRSQATAKAVADARANAEALARAGGLRIVGIKSMQLGGAPVTVLPMARFAANAAPEPTQLDNSNVSVRVMVNVVFSAEPQ